MDVLLSELSLWCVTGLVLVPAFWAGLRPIFKWEINTTAFLGAAQKLITNDNLPRAAKLMNAAPSAPVVQIVLAFVDEGENSAKEVHASYTKQFMVQKLKLILAGTLVVSTWVLAAYLDPTFVPLVVASVVAALVVMKGLHSIRKTQRDCDYVISTWLGDLMITAPKDVASKIGGLDW